ncbi:MAG: [FeFe] hydrogenase H-cluster radical SAM maturase HydG [Bacillota bacterium]
MYKDFIDDQKLLNVLEEVESTKDEIDRIIKKSLKRNPLTLEETAVLLNADDEESVQKIFNGAKTLKENVYGDRVVIFAPLYIGNKCTNGCKYCGFNANNKDMLRKTCTDKEIQKQVKAMESTGQKRTILVYGTHPEYDGDFIAESVQTVYDTKLENGEIRRANINASPMEVEDYKKLVEVGIGTYQIFQETYHHETYKEVHPFGKKSDFEYRITGLDRAMEAGIDDVGIGALFGLYDWKYEVLGLVEHAKHLEDTFGVGPHTISFPRLNDASNIDVSDEYFVSDKELKRIVAILRLAVPYTGLILTAREPAELRSEMFELGVSQIDAGTKIELDGYTKEDEQDLDKEQFEIGDTRSLEEVIYELLENDFTPSFCTACYRLGRTGEHFMEFAKPGFIHEYCIPNACLTLAEYLIDYANEETKKLGFKKIDKKVEELENEEVKAKLIKKLEKVKNEKRDLYF